MNRKKFNYNGFSTTIIILMVAVMGIAVVAGLRVIGNGSTKESITRQAETNQISPLTAQDTVILAEAKKLKKVDFDLDGVRNAQDADDDNDGINDDADNDDDNDGVDDDADNDDDNDGSDDSDDTEAAEAAEAAELEEPDQDQFSQSIVHQGADANFTVFTPNQLMYKHLKTSEQCHTVRSLVKEKEPFGS